MYATRTFAASRKSQHGFTLMELSIVLVVAGILVGAILGGQHLLHTMRLSKVMEQKQSYESTLMLFNERYRALPGDMPNATDYWGAVSSGDGCLSPNVSPYGTSGNGIGAGTGSETCNGDGDDKIGDWDLPDLTHEMFRAWQHLYNAGMVPRSYTGVSGSNTSHHHMDAEVNVNIPAGPFNASGWNIMRLGNYTLDTGTGNPFFNRSYGNVLLLGTERDGYPPMNPVLTPAEARSLDAKSDDALPASGLITTVLDSSSPASLCTTAGGNSTDLEATYNIDSEEVACALYFVLSEEVRGMRDDEY